MKRLISSAVAALVLGSVATAMCPFTTLFFQYGAGCAPGTQAPPILNGQLDGGMTCGVMIDLNVQQPCGHCGVYVKSEWLVLGFQAVNVPMSNGCTLLASPDIVLPLPPAIGSTVLQGELPHNPSLIGHSFFMQGIIERVSTFGNTTDIEVSNGLEMRIVP